MTGEITTTVFDPCERCPILKLEGSNDKAEAIRLAGQRFLEVGGSFDEHGANPADIALRSCAASNCLVDKMPIANPQRVELDA